MVDLADNVAVDRLVLLTLEICGKIDILVNNPAVLQSALFLEVTEEQWDSAMSVNLKAPFLLSQAALWVMSGQKSRYIINIFSTSSGLYLIPPAAVRSRDRTRRYPMGGSP